MSALSRRTVLTALAAGLLSLPLLGRSGIRPARAATAPSDKPGTGTPVADTLVLWGPPAGPSITLAHGQAIGAFASLARSVEVRVWRTPDELRAGLTSGTMDVFVLPTQTAALLYNRGMGVRLVSVMTTGLLYGVCADPQVTGLSDLKKRTIAVPFRNDVPDLLLAYLLRDAGLVPGQDLTVQVTASPVEAVQMLLTGRADCALLPEPAASAALLRARQLFGKTLYRSLDLQALWAKATGASPVLPQAGLGITPAGLNRLGVDAPLRLQQAIAQATDSALRHPDDAARDASDTLGFSADIISRSIPGSNLAAIPARQGRPDLERLFALMPADGASGQLSLPDADFYL